MIKNSFWVWTVFVISLLAYIPLLIGGWKHPVEINVATYSLFAIITGMMFYSAKAQGFEGWRLPLGWCLGNIAILFMAFVFLDGWTFNLGSQEVIILYGLALVVGAWITSAQINKKASPRILFLGAILIDVASFYPLVKQYLLPHDSPTFWMLIGWFMAMLGPILSIIFVERLMSKLLMSEINYKDRYQKDKKISLIIEESGASLENALLYFVTLLLMLR